MSRTEDQTERLRILGKQIRRLRRDRDLSQEALAELASIHRNHLGAIERGTKGASVDTIFDIAAALGVSVSVLFTPFDG